MGNSSLNETAGEDEISRCIQTERLYIALHAGFFVLTELVDMYYHHRPTGQYNIVCSCHVHSLQEIRPYKQTFTYRHQQKHDKTDRIFFFDIFNIVVSILGIYYSCSFVRRTARSVHSCMEYTYWATSFCR